MHEGIECKGNLLACILQLTEPQQHEGQALSLTFLFRAIISSLLLLFVTSFVLVPWQVVNCVAVPPEDQLQSFIPSPAFPSDHLAMVYDLEWRSNPKGEVSPAVAATAHPSAAAGQASSVQGSTNSPGTAADSNKLEASTSYSLAAASSASVPTAAAALRAGKVIAVPTDTLYGLAACANNSAAVQQVYFIKRRLPQKPIAICVADPADVASYGMTDHLPPGLLEDLLPGPVTVMLDKRTNAKLAAELNPGAPAIGVRVPDCAFIRELCHNYGGAIALTSANISGSTSTVEIEEFRDLWPQLGGVFDAGRIRADRAGSTIIDLTKPGHFAIHRQGIDCERVNELLSAKYSLKPQPAAE